MNETEKQRRALEEQKANAENDRAKIQLKYKKLRSNLEKLQNVHPMPQIEQALPEQPKEPKKNHQVSGFEILSVRSFSKLNQIVIFRRNEKKAQNTRIIFPVQAFWIDCLMTWSVL